MILKIDDKDYEVSTSLGVAYEIESTKRKKISDIMEESDNIESMIDVLYFGFKKKNNIPFKEFKDIILNSDMGYVELSKEFAVFTNMLVSTAKTEAEVRKFVEDAYDKKVEEATEELDNLKN